MRLIIEARLEHTESGGIPEEPRVLAVLERGDRNVADLGLSLAEGRALLAQTQTTLVSQQVAGWLAGHMSCRQCGAQLAHKDSRSIIVRTVFGKVQATSPRLLVCDCTIKRGAPRRSFSPLCKAVRQRVTPELEYLQAKWAAHLPYRQATALLSEILPLGKGISLGSTRRRILAVGKALDAEIDCDIANRPRPVTDTSLRESASITCVSVDSAWLNFYSNPKGRQAARDQAELMSPMAMKFTQGRHVNIVAGRATFSSRAPRVYAYVHKQVPSAAGEFAKAVEGSQLARGRILDWFHIAMKFKAADTSVLGSTTIEPIERDAVRTKIEHAKWLVWHGKGRKSAARIKALNAALMPRRGFEDSTLWWNLRRLYFYLENNADTLVNYGARYRKGLPISSSIAESAVNLVVSHRMAKKQQMRWTDEGAHCLAQVRVAALNGELSPARMAELAKRSSANSPFARYAA